MTELAREYGDGLYVLTEEEHISDEVLDQLHYGDYVDILERVERNGNDWGYTGEGWIFMDLTEIQ